MCSRGKFLFSNCGIYGIIDAKRLLYFIAVFLARRSRATEKGGELYHNALRYGIIYKNTWKGGGK